MELGLLGGFGSGEFGSGGSGQGGSGRGVVVGEVGVVYRKEPFITMLHVQVSSDWKNGFATFLLNIAKDDEGPQIDVLSTAKNDKGP